MLCHTAYASTHVQGTFEAASMASVGGQEREHWLVENKILVRNTTSGHAIHCRSFLVPEIHVASVPAIGYFLRPSECRCGFLQAAPCTETLQLHQLPLGYSPQGSTWCCNTPLAWQCFCRVTCTLLHRCSILGGIHALLLSWSQRRCLPTATPPKRFKLFRR